MANETIDGDWVASCIQTILSKVHSHPQKLQIKEKSDRWSFACPICGDSHNRLDEKRGHLFKNNLFYKCYNEDCRSTFTKLCKQFDVTLDPDKKLSLINWVDNNARLYTKAQNSILFNQFDKVFSMEELQEWFDSGLGPLKAFGKVKWGSQVYCYLKARGFVDAQINMMYEGIKTNGRWSEPYIVFLNKVNDKVLGMQERNIQKGDRRRFKVWTFAELHKNIRGTELDPIEESAYNKVSQLFNIFNVNYDKTITIFEAYLDSAFWPNSIGAVGMNTDVHFMTGNELDLQFFFDNDNPGKRKAKEWLMKGFRVFLWDKWAHAMCQASGDYYSMERWIANNVKDLNDIVLKMKLTSYKELLPYFSDDPLDHLWLTGDEKFKKKYIKPDPKIHDVDWVNKMRDLL